MPMHVAQWWLWLGRDLSSQIETEFAADSPLEEEGFEPSVPRLR
jgi:hypothetical protein